MSWDFGKTSRSVDLGSDGKLRALCRRTDGEWVLAELNLDFYLLNDDGTVQLAQASRRPGIFLASCRNVALEGSTILTGDARRRDGTSWVAFRLDLNRNVANIEGRLLWLRDPSQPFDAPDNDDAGLGSYDASTDPNMADYAKSLDKIRLKRDVHITPPSRNDQQDIQNLVRLWTLDYMDAHMGQRTLVEFPRRPPSGEYVPHATGWRIDNQENGSFDRNGLQYYSLAVQRGSAVYASVLVPVRYRVGRTRIRNAFLRSMAAEGVIAIDPPPPNFPQPPAQDDPSAQALFVQSLQWVVVPVGIGLIFL